MNLLFGLCLLMFFPSTDIQEPVPAARGVEFWIEKLESGTTNERAQAARMLSREGANSPKAILALIRALADKQFYSHKQIGLPFPGMFASLAINSSVGTHSGLRRIHPAAEALARIGRPAVPALANGLKAESQCVRNGCAEALAAMGPAAHEAVPALVEALRSGRGSGSVCLALGEIGPLASPAVPDLVRLLESQSHFDRSSAADALGGIGPGARHAVPALVRAARLDLQKSENLLEVQSSGVVRWAIWRIGPESLPGVKQALKEKDKNTRVSAVEILALFGSEAKPLVPDLIEAVSDDVQEVWSKAIFALGEIGPEAKDALPAILFRSKEKCTTDRLRRQIEQTVQKIDPKARPREGLP